MPGLVAPVSAGTDRSPVAAQKTTITSSSIPEPPGREEHHISTKKSYRSSSELHPEQNSLKHKPRKPLSRKERRRITAKTERLIVRRNALNEEIRRAVDKLLQSREWRHLEEQELRHLKKRTKKLARLKKLYRSDPSPDRARDRDLVRTLLRRFKRNLRPTIDDYINQRSDKASKGNETSSSGADRDSNSEWSGISDNEDGEPQQRTLEANLYLHCNPKSLQTEYTDLYDMAITRSSSKARPAPTDTPTGGGKRKREELVEGARTKRVRFAVDEETTDKTIIDKESGDLTFPPKKKMKFNAKTNGESEKEKQAPTQGEAQTNDD
ncbi:hypothetical protein O1611_g9482 [Lasiodiplodia mahajangana]|uniref:Uncharacterized protein n=1 Tax=Lasiodiplodia mahajangana TaxID=1108764 RepID=A0ACC2J8Y0_9PEZI|nr:hypothetical protein O1611_g9482 [Lasiodiplodia mahajangana]